MFTHAPLPPDETLDTPFSVIFKRILGAMFRLFLKLKPIGPSLPINKFNYKSEVHIP